jgi:hypothetical protein
MNPIEKRIEEIKASQKLSPETKARMIGNVINAYIAEHEEKQRQEAVKAKWFGFFDRAKLAGYTPTREDMERVTRGELPL